MLIKQKLNCDVLQKSCKIWLQFYFQSLNKRPYVSVGAPSCCSLREVGQRSSFLGAYGVFSETKVGLRAHNKCEEGKERQREDQQLSKISFIVLIVDIVPQKCHVRSHKSRAESTNSSYFIMSFASLASLHNLQITSSYIYV